MSSTVGARRNPFHGMRRYPDRGWIGGVCEGVALHFGWSARLVRVILVLLVFLTGLWPAVVVYVIAWFVLERGDYPAAKVHSTVIDSAPPPRVQLASLEQRLRSLEAYATSEEFRLRRALQELKD